MTGKMETTNSQIKIKVFSAERYLIMTMEKERLLTQFQYVEELVNFLLDSVSSSSIYRNLFAIRVNDRPPLWLPPNTPIRELCSTKLNQTSKEVIYELRMRFRPSCSHGLKSMCQFDHGTLRLIYNQIQYDFLRTPFIHDDSDSLIVQIWIMVALEIAKQALDKNLSVKAYLEENRKRTFKTPRIMSILFKGLTKAQFWIRKSKLIKSAIICSRKLGGKVELIMSTYIEMFLTKICTTYASECYRIDYLDGLNTKMTLDLRVRFVETNKDNTSCIIETKPLIEDSSWTLLCDIQTIGYGTLHSKVVEIDRSNGSPFEARFDRAWDAKSFLSLIGGYYRLMRKWNFNFCRSVGSPDLNFLIANKIHGPIGSELIHKRLQPNKSPGTFIVRRCIKRLNHYIIDLVTKQSTIIEIEIIHDSCLNIFTLKTTPISKGSSIEEQEDIGNIYKHSTKNVLNDENDEIYQIIESCNTTYKITLNYYSYTSLKALINDLQVWTLNPHNGSFQQPSLQLKYWISSSEYDDYLFLLLSLSKSHIHEMGLNQESIQSSISNLPSIIPQKMIDVPKEVRSSGNMMLVKISSLRQQVEIVVKDFDEKAVRHQNHAIFCSSYQKDTKILNNYISPPQLKIAEWIFLKCPFIADTIGVSLGTSSLIQEYFSLGPLDEYLRVNRVISGELIKVVTRQLLEALLYLQERQIIHGKIRLHNVFITQLEPLTIKITDPLGAIDVNKDRAFLPPEFTSFNGKIYVDEYSISLDIWAFGTTLWQMYSRASYPPANKYANTLIQPKSCPDTIWDPLESCWHSDPSKRASPHSIFRDLNNSPVWLNFHEYESVSRSDAYDDNSTISDAEFSVKNQTNETQLKNYSSSTDQSSDITQEPLRDYVSKLPGYCPPKKRTLKWIRYIRRTSSEISRLEEPEINSLHECDSNSRVLDENRFRASSMSSSSQFSSDDGWAISQEKLKLGHELGRGFYGVVKKAFLKTGHQDLVVAVKCISSANCDEDTTQDLKREFLILKNLNHPNIVKTLGFVEDLNVMLVVEYMPFGSLFTYIKNRPHNVFINMPLKKYSLDIAKGMEYLESMKVVHRDLALRNILLANLEQVKICDFGLAHFLGHSNHYEMKTSRALPLRWYAPETLENQIFTHKSDVWSYGVVLWEIYSGGCSPQYSSQNLIKILKTERLPKPEDCPEDMYNIMKSCWSYEPEERDSFSTVVSKLE